jgi:alkylated DNA repair dioxygenase AlkB
MPSGLLYRQDFITAGEEATLLEEIGRLPLEEARYKAYRARRRIVAFEASVPPFLLPLQARAAELTGRPSADFRHALVTEYRPGTALGWHRDMPEFGLVVGVSLAGPCRMRFRRYPARKGERVFALALEPRSVYVLSGEIRWGWQHSVAPAPALRYSITLRTRS